MTEGGKDVHIYVIMGHFMEYAQALVLSSQTTKCTVQALWDRFIVHRGLLKSVVSDQGQNFERDFIVELCNLAKVQILHTSPYQPQLMSNVKFLSYINKYAGYLSTKESLVGETWCQF